MKSALTICSFLLVILSCKKETTESGSNVYTCPLDATHNTLFHFIKNPANNNILAYTAEFQNHSGEFILFDPSFKVINRVKIASHVNNIATDGQHYYITTGQNLGPGNNGFMYINKYDLNLNMITKIILDSVIQFNTFDSKIVINTDGTIALYAANLKHYSFIRRYIFSKDLSILSKVESGNPNGLYTSSSRIRLTQAISLPDGSHIITCRVAKPEYVGYAIERRDPSYNLLWGKTVGNSADQTGITSLLDMGSGKIAAVGNFGVNFNGKSLYVSLFDYNGNQLQEKVFSSPWYNYRFIGTKTSDGGILAYTQSNQNRSDTYVAVVNKIDANLNLVASNTFGGNKNVAFFPLIVAVESDRNVLGYLDNSFFPTSKAGGYNLTLNMLNNQGELIRE